MDADLRREYVLNAIKQQSKPVSASFLAKELNVSRQVIVGDVALLRAQGNDIIATARGYMTPAFIRGGENVSRRTSEVFVSMQSPAGANSEFLFAPWYSETNQYLSKVVCQHTPGDTRNELYTIVDLGAIVVNVIVEHGYYGEITGCLNLATRKDVDLFIGKVDASEVKLLSELTMGVHLHTIACYDNAHFEEVYLALDVAGYLYKN